MVVHDGLRVLEQVPRQDADHRVRTPDHAGPAQKAHSGERRGRGRLAAQARRVDRGLGVQDLGVAHLGDPARGLGDGPHRAVPTGRSTDADGRGDRLRAQLEAPPETRLVAAEERVGPARLDRHHWKYRNHPKAYKAVLLDSGHLSQTFYLLATERRLGAFYTAAINDLDVAARLGLRPQIEIAIGASGIGVPDPDCDQLHLKPEPYVPVAPVIPDQ